MSQQWIYTLVFFAWLAGAAAFVLGLHQMNSPATARNGNRLSAGGMTVAVVATLIYLITRTGGLSGIGLVIIVVGFLIGGGIGLYLARIVKMTAMPQLVSLFNAVGGGAAALVAIDDYLRIVGQPEQTVSTTIFVVLGAVIGCITFSGSLIASGKLQGLIPGKPIIFPGSRILTIVLAIVTVVGFVGLVLASAGTLSLSSAVSIVILGLIVVAALVFGVTMVLPIGGADMPVVISLLNSFTGTAAAMAGFVINNPVLIIAGALVGASGGILTKLMADAMNRSIANIMVGGFGGGEGTVAAAGGAEGGSVREITADDAAIQLAYAQKVIIVPGIRARGGAGAARRPRAGRAAGGARRRGVVCHPSGRGPHAGPHERAARRGERALPAAARDGRDQPRVQPHGRGARGRRERRHEPGRALEPGLADLRHADPRRGRRQEHRRDQALDGPRLRRHRQRALHEPQDRHALRRRQGRPGPAHLGGQGAL